MDVKRLMFPIWHLASQLSRGELLPSELPISLFTRLHLYFASNVSVPFVAALSACAFLPSGC